MLPELEAKFSLSLPFPLPSPSLFPAELRPLCLWDGRARPSRQSTIGRGSALIFSPSPPSPKDSRNDSPRSIAMPLTKRSADELAGPSKDKKRVATYLDDAMKKILVDELVVRDGSSIDRLIFISFCGGVTPFVFTVRHLPRCLLSRRGAALSVPQQSSGVQQMLSGESVRR